MARLNTRDEILAAAARQFANVGYKGASLHDIAVEVGCSKATLLYHFAGKDAILAALVEPPARELAALDERLSAMSAGQARDAAIEGFVDLVLAYRREIALIYHDLPHLFHQPAFADVKPLTDRLVAALARGTDPSAQLAAKVVLAGTAAVVLDPECATDPDLRATLIGVARRALNTS
ncbi:TetR/AcrR family transcriptional regulator [Luedemannella helvata]|uniref:TetR family transcriptional regulator n=1 Tax=Luedemannella helvata TaxID=349315 RepID=A0ABP4XCC3_9ACTN